MFTKIQELAAYFTANTSGFERGVNTVIGLGGRLNSSLGGYAASVASFFNKMALAAGAMAAATATAITTMVVKTGFEFNAMREAAETSFSTMLGSSSKAKLFLDDLAQFAATTPFELPGLISASQKLLAFGFDAQQIRPMLTAVGDAVAGLGGDPEVLDRVIRTLGQIKAKGKASAEEMMQLAEAGIPAWDFLAQKLGVTIPEAMKAVSKGSVDATTTIAAMTEGMNAKFGGLMAAQSQKFSGLWSTMKDNFAQSAGEMTSGLFNAVRELMSTLVNNGADGFGKLKDSAKSAFDAIGNWIIQHKEQIVQFLSNAAKFFADLIDQAVELGVKLKPLTNALMNVFASDSFLMSGMAMTRGFLIFCIDKLQFIDRILKSITGINFRGVINLLNTATGGSSKTGAAADFKASVEAAKRARQAGGDSPGGDIAPGIPEDMAPDAPGGPDARTPLFNPGSSLGGPGSLATAASAAAATVGSAFVAMADEVKQKIADAYKAAEPSIESVVASFDRLPVAQANDFENRMNALIENLNSGKISTDEFGESIKKLADESTRAADAAQREALLKGDFQGAGLNMQQALEDKIASFRMQQWNQQVEQSFQTWMEMNGFVQQVADGFGQLGHQMDNFGQQLQDVGSQVQGGIGQALGSQQWGTLANFMSSIEGQKTLIMNQISQLQQLIRFAWDYQQKARLQDAINALLNQLNALKPPPPVISGWNEDPLFKDPGLSDAPKNRGGNSVVINSMFPPSPGMERMLTDAVAAALMRMGWRL